MITSLDHIVLSCADVAATVAFYRDLLGLDPREDRPGKFSLHFGTQKISLQADAAKPALARNTVPGTGNLCFLSTEPVEDLADRLRTTGVSIEEGPALKDGATGPIWSIYFRDPDGNLVEVANQR